MVKRADAQPIQSPRTSTPEPVPDRPACRDCILYRCNAAGL